MLKLGTSCEVMIGSAILGKQRFTGICGFKCGGYGLKQNNGHGCLMTLLFAVCSLFSGPPLESNHFKNWWQNAVYLINLTKRYFVCVCLGRDATNAFNSIL